uniref:OTU domain-containing protein n=2 Tax=Panagrellus redivivus TaxID=6233 RepID=A0A7E4WAR0_PANRE
MHVFLMHRIACIFAKPHFRLKFKSCMSTRYHFRPIMNRITFETESVRQLIDTYLIAHPAMTILQLVNNINAMYPDRKRIQRTAVSNWIKKRQQELKPPEAPPPPTAQNVPEPVLVDTVPVANVVPNYYFGLTDHGDKTLLYYDASETHVKVLHLNKEKEEASAAYYRCCHCPTGRATLRFGQLDVRYCGSNCIGKPRNEFHAKQCVRLAKFKIRHGTSMQAAHAIAQAEAIKLGCFEEHFPPYWTMANDYSRLYNAQMDEEPTTLKTGERWLLYKTDSIRIYATDRMLEALANCEIALVDGTFRKSPRNFYQVLTISGLLTSEGTDKQEYQPLLMALLPDKTEESYVEVVNVIKQEWQKRNIKCRIQRMHSDYETGLQNAMKQLVGDDKVYGCLFHYSQALLRHAALHGLYRFYKSDDEDYKTIRQWLRDLLALPCLPPDEVDFMWDHLLQHPPEKPEGCNVVWPEEALQQVRDYMLQWLNITDRTWNFFGLGRTRNTNAMEAFHRIMPCGDRKPSLTRFLHFNNVFFTDVQNQLCRLEKGCRTKRRSKKYEKLQRTVFVMETELTDALTVTEPPTSDKKVELLHKYCRKMSYLLHDIRNKAGATAKSGKTLSVKRRLPNSRPDTVPQGVTVSDATMDDDAKSFSSAVSKSPTGVRFDNKALSNAISANDALDDAIFDDDMYLSAAIIAENMDFSVAISDDDDFSDGGLNSDNRSAGSFYSGDSSDGSFDDNDTSKDDDCCEVKVEDNGFCGEIDEQLSSVDEICKVNTDELENQPPRVKRSFTPYSRPTGNQNLPRQGPFKQFGASPPISSLNMVINANGILSNRNPLQSVISVPAHQPQHYRISIKPVSGRNALVYNSPCVAELQQKCKTMGITWKHMCQAPVAEMDLQKCNRITTLDVNADGHCAYSSVSMLLAGSPNHYMAVRRSVGTAILENKLDKTFYQFSSSSQKELRQLKGKSFQKMHAFDALDPEMWWDEIDAMAFAISQKVNIVVYVDAFNSWSVWNDTSIPSPFNAQICPENPTLLLYFKDAHYMPIVDVE